MLKHSILHPSEVFLLLFVSTVAAQGPIEPSTAPTSSMKTLEQVYNQIEEPRTPISSLPYDITEPGSYYVTRDLYGRGGENGINIQTNNVTLDLNGYTLYGVPDGSGIRVYYAGLYYDGITIRNGCIRNWGSSASYAGLIANYTRGLVVEHMIFMENDARGIISGRGTHICNCTFLKNKNGADVRAGSLIINSLAVSNNSAGLIVDNGSMVQDCTAGFNGMSGIVAVDACRLQGCSVYNNGQSGITANRGCSVLECVAVSNTYGIAVKDNCLVVRNTCSGNARTNSIYAAGILVDGSANRIEGNHVEGNVYGIRIFDSPGTTNLVIRNTALRNSTANYSLQTGTVYGPILSMNNSGVLTNTSPWINFELAP